MRPMLKPALVQAWRDPATVQFGLDPAHARVVGGLTEAGRRVLALLDGTRERAAVVAAAVAEGIDAGATERLLDVLTGAGLLDDAGAEGPIPHPLETGERDRLAPELAALSLLRPQPGAALTTMTRRRAAHVAVVGDGRLATTVSDALRAAGIGRITAYDDVGRLSVDTFSRRRAELVIVATVGVPDLDVVDALDRLQLVHLAVGVRELTGIVGPLVLPGITACLRCLDLHRADRDPGWPTLALQMSRQRLSVRPYAAALAVVTGGVAAVQALAHLDGDDPSARGGTLELALPDWHVRRRSWPPHPDCGCGWRRAG